MSVKLPSFNTDFTCYLDNQPPHTVKLVTNTEIIECSGVILSQHSQVLREQIRQDNEVFLLDYQYVRELLVLLHGGCVDLTVENCLEFVKFACQFKVEGVVEQVYCFLSSVVNSSNVVQCVKVCLGAIKVASFYADDGLGRDLLWPCEDIVDMMSSEEVVEFVSHFEPDEVFAMFVNKIFVKKMLSVCSGLVIESNAESFLESLLLNEDFVEAAALCPEPEITTFFEVVEKLNSLSVKSWKVLHILKKSVFKEKSMSSLNVQVASGNNSHQMLLKDWRSYTGDQMFQLCKLASGINNFYLMEIIISWVSLKKPNLKTVKRLCNAIDPALLPCLYLEHAAAIINLLGYKVTLKTDKGTTSKSSHTFNKKVSVELRHDVHQLSISFICGCPNYGQPPCGKIEVNKAEVVVYCRQSPLSRYAVYGTTEDGKHIPFYADVMAVMTVPIANITLIELDSIEERYTKKARHI
ncbi:uncharacterized protein LOC134814213 [Bolinopsis microptera]|uniref:uncharacterized protein LOC134814213 n=1 Tax=Bolinopsis microptera TaxID=2820187 RepID=UPI00307955EF